MRRLAKVGALSLEDLCSVAENVMESRGFVGRTIVMPTGHVDSPEYQEAIRPIIGWASGIAGHYVNVYASDRMLESEGGVQAMVTGTGSIVTRPVTNELTILHELAHLMCGEWGHTKAFVETAHRLYAAHLGGEAAETFWRVVSPALGARTASTTLYYHVSPAELPVGTVVRPGREVGRSNFEYGDPAEGYLPDWHRDKVWVSDDPRGIDGYAWWMHEHGVERPRVYLVKPQGEVRPSATLGGDFYVDSATVVADITNEAWTDPAVRERIQSTAVTLYHGTNAEAAERIQAEGFQPSDTHQIAQQIEAAYGLPADSVWGHEFFRMARGRSGRNRVYFSSNPSVANSYAQEAGEAVRQGLQAAWSLLHDGALPYFDTPEGDACNAWVRQEMAKRFRPAVITVDLPLTESEERLARHEIALDPPIPPSAIVNVRTAAGMDRSTLRVEAKLANVVEDRYGTKANVVGTPGQGRRIFYNRDTDTLIFTDELAPAGAPRLMGGTSNGAYIAYENGELSPGSGANAPSSQTVYNPLFIEALERLVDTFPEFGRKPLYESSTGDPYNTPARISSVWDFLRSVNEMRAEYARQRGASRAASRPHGFLPVEHRGRREGVLDLDGATPAPSSRVASWRSVLADLGRGEGGAGSPLGVPPVQGGGPRGVDRPAHVRRASVCQPGPPAGGDPQGQLRRQDHAGANQLGSGRASTSSEAHRPAGAGDPARGVPGCSTEGSCSAARGHDPVRLDDRAPEELEAHLTQHGATKTASSAAIYRGLKVDFPSDVRAKINALLAPPMEEDEIDQEQGVARVVVDWLQANHWEAGLGLGRHWSTRKEMAEIAAMQGAPSGVGVVLTATYDASAVDQEYTERHPLFREAESEISIRPGARITITNVELPGYYGVPKGVPLIDAPIQATASSTVRLWRGLQVADVDDGELEAIRRDPAGYARKHLDEPLGIHWTDDPNSAWNFAQGRDPDGWASDSWDDDEGGVWTVGLVLEAEVPTVGVIQRGTEEHDDYSMSDAIIDYGIEREVTVRDGTMVQLTSVTVVATNEDGSDVEFHAGLGLTKRAWNTNGITLFHGTIAYYADQVLAEGLKPRNATGVANHWSTEAISYEGRVYLSHGSRMTVSRSAMRSARKAVMLKLYPEITELEEQASRIYDSEKRMELDRRRYALEREAQDDPRLESVILAVTIPPSAWGNLEPDEDTRFFTEPTTTMTGFPEWMSSLGSDAVVAYRGEIPPSWIRLQARGKAADQAGMYSPEGDDWRR